MGPNLSRSTLDQLRHTAEVLTDVFYSAGNETHTNDSLKWL